MVNYSFKKVQRCILKVYFSFFQVAAKWFFIHFHLLKPHPLPSTPSPGAPTVASQLLNSPKTRYTEPALFTATGRCRSFVMLQPHVHVERSEFFICTYFKLQSVKHLQSSIKLNGGQQLSSSPPVQNI